MESAQAARDALVSFPPGVKGVKWLEEEISYEVGMVACG